MRLCIFGLYGAIQMLLLLFITVIMLRAIQNMQQCSAQQPNTTAYSISYKTNM